MPVNPVSASSNDPRYETRPVERTTRRLGPGLGRVLLPCNLKLIGILEVAAAAGLILPAAFNIAPVLVPLAAAGLIVVMAGAVVTHGRRSEWPNVAVNIVLAVLAAIVAWGRFGPYAF
jgi:hypothetical protein